MSRNRGDPKKMFAQNPINIKEGPPTMKKFSIHAANTALPNCYLGHMPPRAPALPHASFSLALAMGPGTQKVASRT